VLSAGNRSHVRKYAMNASGGDNMKFILTSQGLAEVPSITQPGGVLSPLLSGVGDQLGASIAELIRHVGEAIIAQLPGAFTFLAMCLVLIGMILAEGKWFARGLVSFIAGALSLTAQ
jgi:hypothetical protein